MEQNLSTPIEMSFIVPCFNAEKTILRCVEHIIAAQKALEKSEIIVVDNGSTDGTRMLCERLPVKIVSEPHLGRSNARNSGAKAARGNWLAFVDADTLVSPDWARKLLDKFQIVGAVGGQGKIIPIGEEDLFNRFRRFQSHESTLGTYILLQKETFESPMINSAACVYQREVFERVGGFDSHLSRHEDIDLSKRIHLSGGALTFSEEAVAEVLYHGNGWWDYWLRSFEDGKTKIAYFDKWSHLGIEGVTLSWKEKVFVSLRDISSSLIKLIKSPNILQLLSLLFLMTNYLGKAFGLLTVKYEGRVAFETL